MELAQYKCIIIMPLHGLYFVSYAVRNELYTCTVCIMSCFILFLVLMSCVTYYNYQMFIQYYAYLLIVIKQQMHVYSILYSS